MTDTITRDSAYEALRFIYPTLNVTKSQVTPQAAAFAFKVLVKVDQGTRFSSGLFKLNRVYTSWSSIPTAFAQAVYTALKNPDAKLKNAVASAFIAKQHRRNLQQHLLMPDVMPCPDFKF
ncbi:MAG: hypothetical protein Rubg2KO_02590 [Rubricoccaceae bacterium]